MNAVTKDDEFEGEEETVEEEPTILKMGHQGRVLPPFYGASSLHTSGPTGRSK